MSEVRRRYSRVCWALGLIVCCAQPAAAARLLQVYIEQDGELVAHTYYDDGGRADAARVWRYLAQPPIMVDDDVTKLVPSAGDPLRVDLEGDLVVKFQHTDHVIAQARLARLTLRRQDPQTQAWFLSGAEVERTAAAAGLGPSTTPLLSRTIPSLSPAAIGALGLAALTLVLLGIAFLWTRQVAAKS